MLELKSLREAGSHRPTETPDNQVSTSGTAPFSVDPLFDGGRATVEAEGQQK
jgi:hypothetical protein